MIRQDSESRELALAKIMLNKYTRKDGGGGGGGGVAPTCGEEELQRGQPRTGKK
jgi:hypothetical protein